MRLQVVPIAFFISATAVFPLIAHADTTGFNDGNGWKYNQPLDDLGATADLPDADTIHITNLGTGQHRSFFYQTPQGTMQFATTFLYRAANASVFGCDYGAAFVLQNSPAGFNAVGSPGSGYGYGGITNSAAITFGLQSNSSGYSTNGNIGGGANSVGPNISFISGHPIAVTLNYNDSILAETLQDQVTSAIWTHNHIVGDSSQVLGGTSAYVGFSASTTIGQCSGNAADQYFSGFQFTTIPEPTALSLLTMIILIVNRRPPTGARLLRMQERQQTHSC